ncbi:SOS cell division inhibitor [Marinobacter sp.]|uniref:SOS cell division inhibitor n=1 Tax=Marinobacter sp. TaxID=50741 RepID=UPI00384BD833
MAQALEQLDTLIDDLRREITKEDWEAVTSLNGRVASRVEAAMSELAAGDISAEAVEERLTDLQALCGQAERGARSAREEILATLKGLNQTRSAARSYEDISTRRSR